VGEKKDQKGTGQGMTSVGLVDHRGIRMRTPEEERKVLKNPSWKFRKRRGDLYRGRGTLKGKVSRCVRKDGAAAVCRGRDGQI